MPRSTMAKVVKREELANYVTNEKLDARTRDVLSALEVVRQELKAEIGSVTSVLSLELAQHTRTILEAMTSQISAVDDKYADLPGRVS